MSSFCTDSVWDRSEDENKSCSVGVVQVYTDNTVTTLKANATVAYPVHVTHLYFTKEFCWYKIYYGDIIAGLLPVSTAAQVNGA